MKPKKYSNGPASGYNGKCEVLESVLKDKSPGGVVSLIQTMGLGEFVYHPDLVVFMRTTATHAESLAIGHWLIKHRDAVQQYLDLNVRAARH